MNKRYHQRLLLRNILTYALVIAAGVFTIPAQAVDYRDLAIEQQVKQRQETKEKSAGKPAKTDDDSVFEQEKAYLSRQLTIITGDEDTRYTIVKGDTLHIQYQDRGKPIEETYQVNAQGEIVMPIIGAVKISGMNRGHARHYLNERMGEYIRVPKVTIEINTTGKYTILGAAGPGVYVLQSDLHLMEALLKAGFDEQRANLGTVLVMRGSKEKPDVLRLNLKKMIKRGDQSDNIALKPGDLIYVPNSVIYDFDKFKDKMFEYLAGYYTLGGTFTLFNNNPESSSGSE